MALFILATFTVVLYSGHCFDYKVVDLTHIHGNDSIYWPTHTGYELIYSQRGNFGDGLWVASYTLKTTEHLGTHLDAPVHFNQYSWTTHQIPIDHLVGPGVIIDVKDKVKNDLDYRVTVADIEKWEENNGRIPNGAIVIMNSGWHERYPDKKRVFNTEDPIDTKTFHFPSWHEDTVAWMVAHRTIHVLGVDTPSLDYGQSRKFPVHVLISSENICGLENVGYLDRIPASGTIISIGAMKTENGSGCPARVIALIPQGKSTSGANKQQTFLIFIVLCFIYHILLTY
ncbi:Hypothetical predicted protein [Mytilus galloprovincialis]|uniref:Kynurenine formamidase n=1 Tax=Mytilus galloprovincialis TaxID=29158 RepID=A0A8B6C5I4_MYTGA|nr:Hypothetical predicted protein [Mytilus galloprovincialis]